MAVGFDSPMGTLRGDRFSARRKVCSGRQTSNSTPNCPSPAPWLTIHSALSACAGAATPLERTAHGTGATPYLPGHATAAIRAAADLSAARYGSPPSVRCARALPRPLKR